MATEAEKAVAARRRHGCVGPVPPWPRTCCSAMNHELREENIFTVLANEPFTTKRAEPLVYAMSDGGHGGMVPIEYCPFCGTRFVWEAR